MSYKPIDYSTWDFSGKGKNITTLLTPIENETWKKALPFQDKRDDKGHAEVVTYFALKLLEQIKTKREIVVPSAILHDTGWSQMSKNELELFRDENWKRYEQVLRARHQEEGVKVAKEVLTKLDYVEEEQEEVLEIISQHDTRKGFLSLEDGIVRDADKLWRFSLSEVIAVKNRWGMSFDEWKAGKKELTEKEGFFYSDFARQIARIELENTLESYEIMK